MDYRIAREQTPLPTEDADAVVMDVVDLESKVELESASKKDDKALDCMEETP